MTEGISTLRIELAFKTFERRKKSKNLFEPKGKPDTFPVAEYDSSILNPQL